jgi:hypothetical protein
MHEHAGLSGRDYRRGPLPVESALTDRRGQTLANQQILQTYFPRLKFKGTAKSFKAARAHPRASTT